MRIQSGKFDVENAKEVGALTARMRLGIFQLGGGFHELRRQAVVAIRIDGGMRYEASDLQRMKFR